MKQTVYSNKKGISELKKALKKFVNIVASSYGVNGKNTIIEIVDQTPLSTNDGIRILNSIVPVTPIERVAKKLLLDVAKKTERLAGDGTTTAVLLAGKLSIESLSLIEKNKYTYKELEAYLDDFYNKTFLNFVKEFSYKIENKQDYYKLALISSRSKEIAELIANLFDEVSENCFTQYKENQKEPVNKVDIFKGVIFDGDIFGDDFLNDKIKMETTLKDTKIIITSKTLNSLDEIYGKDFGIYTEDTSSPNFVPYKDRMPCIYNIAKENGWENIILICNNINEKQSEVLHNLRINWKNEKAPLKIIPIKAPYGEEKQVALLEDLAAMLNATVINNHKGMSLLNLKEEYFGSAKDVLINFKELRFSGIKKDKNKVSERRSNLETLLTNPEDLGNREVYDFLIDRKKTLSDETATLYIAGKTETETGDLLTRAEDALNTVTKARKAGYVVGGGSFYIKISKSLNWEDKRMKYFNEAIVRVLNTPFNSLLKNSGMDFKVDSLSYITNNNILRNLYLYYIDMNQKYKKFTNKKHNIFLKLETLLSYPEMGVNFETGNIVDMQKEGIIDSLTAVRESLNLSVSLAKTLCKTHIILAEEKDKIEKVK